MSNVVDADMVGAESFDVKDTAGKQLPCHSLTVIKSSAVLGLEDMELGVRA